MAQMIRLYVGFDHREAVAYHTFCQSVIDNCSVPVSITPLVLKSLPGYIERHRDGSNTFVYSRFLVPHLSDQRGWAIYLDGDMICAADIAALWGLRDPTKAVQVIKHDYKTSARNKYLRNKNEDYPRKNWSSVIAWNCEHPANRMLTPEFVMNQSGAYLHRFSWLPDDLIGELPKEWNWLTTEYADNYDAHLLHYTLGTPCFSDYREAPMSDVWHRYHQRSQSGVETHPLESSRANYPAEDQTSIQFPQNAAAG